MSPSRISRWNRFSLQHARRFARMTGLCTQVQVRKDQRVVHVRIHTSVVAARLLRVDEIASILVHKGNYGSKPGIGF